MFKAPTLPKQPKFTAQEFVHDAKLFGEVVAKHFLGFIQERFAKHEYDFTAIEQITEHPIDKRQLAKGMTVTKSIMFIKKNQFIGGYTYKEIISMLEYGRADKGIEPDPIIRKAFKDYEPLYKRAVRKFVTGSDKPIIRKIK